jgi:hypothetical protein
LDQSTNQRYLLLLENNSIGKDMEQNGCNLGCDSITAITHRDQVKANKISDGTACPQADI